MYPILSNSFAIHRGQPLQHIILCKNKISTSSANNAASNERWSLFDRQRVVDSEEHKLLYNVYLRHPACRGEHFTKTSSKLIIACHQSFRGRPFHENWNARTDCLSVRAFQLLYSKFVITFRGLKAEQVRQKIQNV